MNWKKRNMIGMILVFGIFLSFGIVSSYTSSSIQYSQYQSSGGFDWISSLSTDSSVCQEGQDFLIQLAPFGCTPAVVRSDLLEEQNVPIFCQLAATKINPLIEVQAIESLSFTGNYPKEIAGVGFQPARAALGGTGGLNTPTVLDNIGYAVIVLKQQSNESGMPDFVEGNLSVKIKYDIKNAFGIGKASFYLPVMSDEDWESRKTQYGFWNGKGYLRAEGIDGNRVKVSVYDGTGKVYKSVVLDGEKSTSEKMYLPGFYCLSSLELKLEKLEAPETRARLLIDNDYVEVKKGESFLEGRCSVTDLFEAGILDRVTIKCKEDEIGGKFGSKNHVLSIVPKLNLSVDDQSKEYGVGDLLYTYKEEGSAREYYVYLAYANTKGSTGLERDLEIGIISIPYESNPADSKLDESTINYVGRLAKAYEWEASKGKGSILNVLSQAGQFISGSVSNLMSNIISGKSVTFVSKTKITNLGGEEMGYVYGGKYIIIHGFASPIDFNLEAIETSDMADALTNYDLAKKDFEGVINSYALEKPESDEETYGEKALRELITLNRGLFQKRTVIDLCEQYKEKYKKELDFCSGLKISNSDIDSTFVSVNGRTREISLAGIIEPDSSEYSADIWITGPNGNRQKYTLVKGRSIFLDDFRGQPDEAFDLGKGSTSEKLVNLQFTELLGSNLYVRYDSLFNIWQWNYGGKGWNGVDKDSSSVGLTPSRVSLLKSLIGKDFDTGKKIVLTELGYPESIELVDLDTNEAKVRISVWGKDTSKKVIGTLVSESHTLLIGKKETFGSEYSFSLDKINLKKNAIVSVNPGIENTGSQANFSFKVGIEKRSIQLSPGRIQTMITNLNETIEKWNKTSVTLGKIVKAGKSLCLVGGLVLVTKNLIANAGGKGIARQEVMRGVGGWNERCSTLVANKTYSTLDQCYYENSNAIDKSVEGYYNNLQAQQKKTQEWQQGAEKSGGVLQDSYVDSNVVVEKGAPQVQADLEKWGLGQINTSEGMVNISEKLTLANYKQGAFTTEELRDIHLNARILQDSSATPELKAQANASLNSLLGKVNSALKENEAASDLAEKYKGITPSDISRAVVKNQQVLNYGGKKGSDFGLNSNYSNEPVQIVLSDKAYFVVLEQSSVVKGEYSIKTEDGGMIIFDESKNRVLKESIPQEFQTMKFVQLDASSYKNKGFKNPKIQFYDTDPYAGLPAVVPIDTVDGWYVATKQSLSVFGGVGAYDKSGRVSSFYLCNVGNNGLQEFNTGFGDDNCQMINLGTGMAYNQFSGLDERETKKYIDCGVQAIEQASKAYKSNKIKIETKCGTVTSEVGEPAVNIPAIQCQDFMSPSDCQIMYNLCDPVMCPSSRCNLGGAYPVRDPIQTGIIGGFLLCLPNIKEGVYIPLCLTGIQAGLDGLISVFVAHRDCLQTQLATGKTVGICDEIQSFYLCDLLWKNALPFLETGLPRIISAIVGGGGTRGGGEYMGFKNAWDTAGKSFTYFTQSYAVNSFQAFRALSAEQIGGEVCKSFVSGVVPSMDFLDKLTEPDSPFQYTARFDEMPYTTTTNPPMSQYKVYYHIYAGKDAPAYYRVYLKGSPESSYYQDTSQSRTVNQGNIPAGGYADETKDFTAPSGYKQLCISVNGNEECGFKEVSTSMAQDYVKDQYIKEQASATDVKTEAECISGSVSGYSLLNPNLQSGISGAINGEAYNNGIVRVCATENPGKGTDPNAGGNGSRWVEVGYCGDTKLKCWMDTSRIKDITSFKTTESSILSDLYSNTEKLLNEAGEYVESKDVEAELKEISKEDNLTQIEELTELIGKVFYNRDRAKLQIERGKVYNKIAKALFDAEIKRLELERSAQFKQPETPKPVEGEVEIPIDETPGEEFKIVNFNEDNLYESLVSYDLDTDAYIFLRLFADELYSKSESTVDLRILDNVTKNLENEKIYATGSKEKLSYFLNKLGFNSSINKMEYSLILEDVDVKRFRGTQNRFIARKGLSCPQGWINVGSIRNDESGAFQDCSFKSLEKDEWLNFCVDKKYSFITPGGTSIDLAPFYLHYGEECPNFFTKLAEIDIQPELEDYVWADTCDNFLCTSFSKVKGKDGKVLLCVHNDWKNVFAVTNWRCENNKVYTYLNQLQGDMVTFTAALEDASDNWAYSYFNENVLQTDGAIDSGDVLYICLPKTNTLYNTGVCKS